MQDLTVINRTGYHERSIDHPRLLCAAPYAALRLDDPDTGETV
jgi:hypothetical protein